MALAQVEDNILSRWSWLVLRSAALLAGLVAYLLFLVGLLGVLLPSAMIQSITSRDNNRDEGEDRYLEW